MPSCGPKIWTAGAASDSDDERMSTMAQARAIGDCAFAELGFQALFFSSHMAACKFTFN